MIGNDFTFYAKIKGVNELKKIHKIEFLSSFGLYLDVWETVTVSKNYNKDQLAWIENGNGFKVYECRNAKESTLKKTTADKPGKTGILKNK